MLVVPQSCVTCTCVPDHDHSVFEPLQDFKSQVLQTAIGAAMTVADDDPRIERCGFAKLQGVDNAFEYFIRKYEVTLGRKSNNSQADVLVGACMRTSSRVCKPTKPRGTQQHLPQARCHPVQLCQGCVVCTAACTNPQRGTGAFELEVLSKNGVTIEGTLHTPDSGPVSLHSQDTIMVSNQSFVFLLPKDIRRYVENHHRRQTRLHTHRDRARAAALANIKKCVSCIKAPPLS